MSSNTLPLRVLALAAAGASVAAGIARLVRRRRARAGEEQLREPVREFRCACGQEFRVTGADRHTVFWVAGAPESDPVLGHTCPRCDRELPVSA
jgi:hypothetical protein